jgi:hypothetical protein
MILIFVVSLTYDTHIINTNKTKTKLWQKTQQYCSTHLIF